VTCQPVSDHPFRIAGGVIITVSGIPKINTGRNRLVKDFKRFLFTDPRTGPLAPSSADLLFDALSQSQTGIDRLRAGLAPKTTLAHKTGTSGRYPNGAVDAVNDAGIAFLIGGTRPVIIVAFLNGARGTDAQNDAAIAALARAVARAVR